MLVFLDIDGVMVPAKGWKSPDFLEDGFPVFSAKATAALNHIITSHVTIMLTTSHKANFSIEQWKSLFKNRNIFIEKLEALPENTTNITRREEIVNWFNHNIIHEDFVIIDDDKSLNDLPQFLKKFLVQTSPYIGLTEEHSELVKSLLSLNENADSSKI